MRRKYLLIPIGTILIASSLGFGISLIADSGYNNGELLQMIPGAVIMLVGVVIGSGLINYALTNTQNYDKTSSAENTEKIE